MYDIVMDFAEAEQVDAEANNECVVPTTFKNEAATGYRRWADYAAATGLAAAWRAWSEDEACAQRDVAADTEAVHNATPWCERDDAGTPTTCTDALEPNDSRATAKAVTGTVADLRICAADEDWLRIDAGGAVRIEFAHATGDLDLTAYDASGAQTATSAGTGNVETVTVPAGGYVKVFGYSGAQAPYRVVAP
jgi:hypothetical protein